MDCHGSSSFDELPDEVLQLIFAAVDDCKSLIQCMAVSKVFQGHASKVRALKITCPGQFSTYDQKLWNVYSMIKSFKTLESLIVCIGERKNEPPASWAPCMRYAEIGLAVEKFVFMAAKSGDFVEFEVALGIRPQFANDNAKKFEGDFTSYNEHKITAFKKKIENKVHPSPLDDNKITFFTKGEDDRKTSSIHMNTTLSTPRQEPLILSNTNLRPTFKSDRYAIKSIDSNVAKNTFLTSHSNTQKTLNSNIAPPSENDLECEIGESSERSGIENCLEGQISLCKKKNKIPKQHHFHPKDLNVPIINFHLKQVITPSNDVLKKMVPVIVFAIVQGLDEFRDTIPNFIEKFVKLKRFVLVDIVESLTIHMREHQIQQVRTERLETISKLISESVIFKNNFDTNNKNEKKPIDEIKFSDRDENEICQGNQGNKFEYEYDNQSPDVNKTANDFQKIEGITNPSLKSQIAEIRTKLCDSNVENKPSKFESKTLQDKRTFEAINTIDEPETPKIPNQIIKHHTLNNNCKVCQNCQIEGNIGICWHCFPNSSRNFIPSNNCIEINTLGCKLPPLPHVEQFSENWSCSDPNLRAWLKGKQLLGGPKDIFQTLETNIKHIESIPKAHKKQENCPKVKSSKETMAYQIQEDLSKKPLSTIINSNLRKINGVSLNPHITFLNNENLGVIRKNVNQISIGPLISIMKKPENFKNVDILKNSLHNSKNIHGLVQDDLELNFWKNPPYFEGGSQGSSVSFNSSINENPGLNVKLRRPSAHQTKLNEKNMSLEKSRCLDDLNTNSKSCKLKYKSSFKKYVNMKDSCPKSFGKHSFKRRLQKDTSRRCEGDRASRIANSRRYGNDNKLKSNVGMEGSWQKKGVKDDIPLIAKERDDLKDFWNFINTPYYIRNENYYDTISNLNIENIENIENIKEIKGKMIVGESSNDNTTASTNKMPFKSHNEILLTKQINVTENTNEINNSSNYTTLHENEQFSHTTLNNNEQLNSAHLEGEVLVSSKSDATEINDRPHGLCDLKKTNLHSLTSYDNTNFINIEDYPIKNNNLRLISKNDDMHHKKDAWLGTRIRERNATQRLGRRARSLRRENHAYGEREREARRERIREGIQKRQRDIEQEALFFDISFWRSDQVTTQNYVLSEVSMCIATHDAKSLSKEELELLSTIALAGPLLVATVACVNEQIGSHNL